jgi:hypothetical protein
METFRFRPNLLRLEERLTPATVADIASTAAFLGRQAEDMEWMAHPSAREWVQNYFTGLYQNMMSTLPTLSDPAAASTAQNLAGFAVSVGNWIGFSVVPEVPPPPAPPPDAGMVNTMPSPTAPQWQPQLNGLKSWDIKVGTGEAVATGDTVTVYYTGWRVANGVKFDDARHPESPLTIDLDNTIAGWKQGVVGMKPGGIRRLFIPSDMAYGDPAPTGRPSGDLIFEIKLVSHT